MSEVSSSALPASPDAKFLYLLGVGVMHSIAPPMHNTIAKALGKPWTFKNRECPTVEDMVAVLHEPTFAGGVITMPYKQSVIPHLAGLDDAALSIGAVNNVYLTPDGQLRGTNTDWEGVRGCLHSADPHGRGRGRPGLVIGAGGASRAAIYALRAELGCSTIYVINRDISEVEQLLADCQRHKIEDKSQLKIVHVTSVAQAEKLAKPFYVVGTVPDLEPKTESEIEMRAILEVLLDTEDKGVLLDMCFKPRNTRTLKLARSLGWSCVEGTHVIGYQMETQWKLWTREDISSKLPKDEAWAVLRRGAEESKAINF